MDHSIVKFPGEDKDETGADMDTFTAILNRDVEGNKSIPKLSNLDHGHLSQGINYRSNNSVSHDSHWLNFNQHKITNCQIQQDICTYRPQEPHGSTMAGNIIQNPHITSQRVQNQVILSQLPTQKLENISNTANQINMEKLIPLIETQLDKDRIMELQRLYIKFKRKEISREVFVLLLREMVGKQMITMTVNKMLTQEARISEAGSSNVRNKMNGQGSEIREPELDSYRKNVNEVNTEREREHFDFSQRGFYGSHGIHGLLSSSNVNSLLAKSSLKRQSIGKHMRHDTGHQFSSGAHLGTVNQSTNAYMEVKRSTLNSSSASPMHPSPMPRSITAQLNLQIPLEASSEGLGNVANTSRKKPSIGQKKPLEFFVSSPSQPSKKQKVCDSLADQSIEQLNDVTAVSGVNLREEEEQLFSGSKENSRVSETSQRVVKEEEERLILQKLPLKNKLAEIMSKYGLKNKNGDVERCLSLGVEERMCVFIHSMIRLSKQRADIEKSRHWTIVTSDIQKQIMEINQKAKEELDMKLFEAERLQKPNEQEDSDGVNGEKEKEDGHAKSLKQTQVRNKEEDHIMRASAANMAARAAVGGDDMFSKWQVMAEQARQKRENGNNVAVSSHLGGNVSLESASSHAKASRDNQQTERGGKQNADAVYGKGSGGKFMRSQKMPQTEVVRTISVKDAISVLEMEPQMSKSKLLYCLYEKFSADIVT